MSSFSFLSRFFWVLLLWLSVSGQAHGNSWEYLLSPQQRQNLNLGPKINNNLLVTFQQPACATAKENAPDLIVDAFCQKAGPKFRPLCTSMMENALGILDQFGLGNEPAEPLPFSLKNLESFIQRKFALVDNNQLCLCLQAIAQLPAGSVRTTDIDAITPQACHSVFSERQCRTVSHACDCESAGTGEFSFNALNHITQGITPTSACRGMLTIYQVEYVDWNARPEMATEACEDAYGRDFSAGTSCTYDLNSVTCAEVCL